ncbi:hypothetical protein ACFSSC_02625 [Corynebacterium mendelii]|uniref:Uncharacterized protein n=1 Tax=Corynebacterium mendelii TaxID=2765362 RepID=A0A939E013_9CORY|nr:hypothetical protein [Corynebacterium mendelii]MBN9644173.1 hypothetical protein [Corynebacterium mendelii]
MNSDAHAPSTSSRWPDDALARLGKGSLARTENIVWTAGIFAVVALPFVLAATGHPLVALLLVAVLAVLGLWRAWAGGCSNRPTNAAGITGTLLTRRRILVVVAAAVVYMTYANASFFRDHDWRIAAAVALTLGVIAAVVSWMIFFPHPQPVAHTAADNRVGGQCADRVQLAVACTMRGLGCTPGWREVTDKRISTVLGIDRVQVARALQELQAAGLADNRRQRGWNPAKDPDTIHGQLSPAGVAAVEAELAHHAA